MNNPGIPEKILRVIGMAVALVYIPLSPYLILGLQGFGGSVAGFYLALGGVVLAIVTYPFVFAGFLKRYRLRPPIYLAVALIIAYLIEYSLMGPGLELEGLSVVLIITLPAILYVIGWAINRTKGAPMGGPPAPKEPRTTTYRATSHAP